MKNIAVVYESEVLKRFLIEKLGDDFPLMEMSAKHKCKHIQELAAMMVANFDEACTPDELHDPEEDDQDGIVALLKAMGTEFESMYGMSTLYFTIIDLAGTAMAVVTTN